MIRIKNLTKIYNHGKHNETTAVKDFNLEIKQGGETIILSGVSGSGKSTILNMISGVMKPTSGIIQINERLISKLPDKFSASFRRDTIGIIFQQFNLISDMSVADNIAIPLTPPTGMSYKEISKRVDELLIKLELSDRKSVNAQNLSGGEMQRVAIARALINNPEIILADEPTANLDMPLTNALIEMLNALQQEGKTIIIATHDPAILNSSIANRIIPITKES